MQILTQLPCLIWLIGEKTECAVSVWTRNAALLSELLSSEKYPRNVVE